MVFSEKSFMKSVAAQTRLLATTLLISFVALPQSSFADGGAFSDRGAQDFEFTLGGGIGFRPSYEGSDEYELVGFPIVIPHFFDASALAGRVDARGLGDIRFIALRSDPTGRSGFVAGPLAGYRFEREQDDGDLLRGLGDIDAGFVAGAFVGYRFGDYGIDAAWKHQFGDDDLGFLLDFSATAKRKITPSVELTARVGTTYADEDYTQTFFGVSNAQTLTSVAGLQAFDASEGIKDVYVQFGSKIALTDKWTAGAMLRYARLVGDAADSPIVESEDQFFGNFSLSYRFGR